MPDLRSRVSRRSAVLLQPKRLGRFLMRLLVSTAAVVAFMVLTQTIQLFPGVLLSLPYRLGRNPPPIPSGIEPFQLITVDGETLSVWKMGSGPPVLFVHGNGGDLWAFLQVQHWLAHAGFTAYSFDFRGYGVSTGWPSSATALSDARQVLAFITEKEGVPVPDVILMGNSIGSGPAALLAAEVSSKTLVLLSPFTTLEEVVEDTIPLAGAVLSPFLWNEFNVRRAVQSLPRTCLVLAHGGADTVIPVAHSKALRTSYRGTGTVHFLLAEPAGHNDILGYVADAVIGALDECATSAGAGAVASEEAEVRAR